MVSFRKYFLLFLLIVYPFVALFADCKGCCSSHGGVICISDKTICKDQTALSSECASKNCDVCKFKLNTLREGKKYDRSFFGKWKDIDNNCQDTRIELLIEKTVIDPVYKNKNKCKLISGKWIDFYSGETLNSLDLVDIDHVVSLKHAWEHGAKNWTQLSREKFANDKENLVITNKSYNRSKGAKTILEWLPSKHEYACKFLDKWFYIKKKYNLEISKEEFEVLNVSKCH